MCSEALHTDTSLFKGIPGRNTLISSNSFMRTKNRRRAGTELGLRCIGAAASSPLNMTEEAPNCWTESEAGNSRLSKLQKRISSECLLKKSCCETVRNYFFMLLATKTKDGYVCLKNSKGSKQFLNHLLIIAVISWEQGCAERSFHDAYFFHVAVWR